MARPVELGYVLLVHGVSWQAGSVELGQGQVGFVMAQYGCVRQGYAGMVRKIKSKGEKYEIWKKTWI